MAAETPSERYNRLLAVSKSPQGRKLLDLISAAEGTAGGKYDGYNVMAGYNRTFSDFSTHPDAPTYLNIPSKSGKRVRVKSSAAGRYQFMKNTWNSLNKQFDNKLTFNPQDQDVAALALADSNGTLKAWMAGDIDKTLDKGSSIWAALGPRLGQPYRSRQWVDAWLTNPSSAVGIANVKPTDSQLINGSGSSPGTNLTGLAAALNSPLPQNSYEDALNEVVRRYGNPNVTFPAINFNPKPTASTADAISAMMQSFTTNNNAGADAGTNANNMLATLALLQNTQGAQGSNGIAANAYNLGLTSPNSANLAGAIPGMAGSVEGAEGDTSGLTPFTPDDSPTPAEQGSDDIGDSSFTGVDYDKLRRLDKMIADNELNSIRDQQLHMMFGNPNEPYSPRAQMPDSVSSYINGLLA